MRTLRLYFQRTFAALASSFTITLASVFFLAVTAFLFVYALAAAEGHADTLPALWATAATVTLPFFAAFVTMRTVADDRRSGRLVLVLAAPVSLRDYVFGRYLGSLAYGLLVLLCYLAVPLFILPFFATGPAGQVAALPFLPAFAALFLQTAVYAAVGVAMSAGTRSAALACAGTVFLSVLLPQALYRGACALSGFLRAAHPLYPAEEHLADAARGLFHLTDAVLGLGVILLALFAAVQAVAGTRFAGRGAWRRRLSSLGTFLSALLFTVLTGAVAAKADFTWSVPASAPATSFSARTHSILAEGSGEVRVTCFLARRDPLWPQAHALLRGLEAAARGAAGLRLSALFADPTWDLSTARRLLNLGVPEGQLVFEKGHRRILLPVAEADEAACAAALLRLSLPALREKVYFLSGHGEYALGDYDPAAGYATLARMLRQEGYALETFDSLATDAWPLDCGVMVVAGTRMPLAAKEVARLEAYLRQGGRVMLLLSPEAIAANWNAFLGAWGVTILPFTAVSPHTEDGEDLVARAFGAHVITRPLAGTSVVFQRARPLAAANGSDAAAVFAPLVSTDDKAWGESDAAHRPWTFDATQEPAGPLCLAAAVERGGGRRRDLAVKPSRLVVVGDASFVTDGALKARANANRDFFRNALAWLAGYDAATASGTPIGVLRTDMDRPARVRLGLCAVVLWPLLLLAAGGLPALRRRGF